MISRSYSKDQHLQEAITHLYSAKNEEDGDSEVLSEIIDQLEDHRKNEKKGWERCRDCPHLSDCLEDLKDAIEERLQEDERIKTRIDVEQIIQEASNFRSCPHCGNPDLENEHYCQECDHRISVPNDAQHFAKYLSDNYMRRIDQG